MDSTTQLEILELVEQFGDARVWEAAQKMLRKKKRADKAAAEQERVLKRIVALLNAFPETGAPDKMYGEGDLTFPTRTAKTFTEAIGFETPDGPVAVDEPHDEPPPSLINKNLPGNHG